MIHSVEVIHQHEDGPDTYAIGNTVLPSKEKIQRIEGIILEYPDHFDRSYVCYGEVGQEIMRIENCPVVVRYKPE